MPIHSCNFGGWNNPMRRCARSLLIVLAVVTSGTAQTGDSQFLKPDRTTFEASGLVRVSGQSPDMAMPPNQALKPQSLATADFNRDGFPDLVLGYEAAKRGRLMVHLGSRDAFAPMAPEVMSGVSSGVFRPPFVSTSAVVETEVSPRFLEACDVNRDGILDIVFATRGDNAIHYLEGDGDGGFGPERKVRVRGAITALAAGSLRGGDATHLAIGGISDREPRSWCID